MAETRSSPDVLAPLLARLPRLARLLPHLPAAAVVEQSLRDVAMIATSWLQYRPVARTYVRTTSEAPAAGTLTVIGTHDEADGTRTLELARPTGFSFEAGQFLTLALPLPTGELRRSYSLASPPHEETLRLGVKRVTGGAGSAWLHDVPIGTRLRFRGPSGSFTYRPRAAPHRLLLLAGGSGITPILSIVKTALDASPTAPITLYYAARRPAEMAYRRELLALAEAHPALIVRLFFDVMPSDEREPSRDIETDANERTMSRATVGRIGALDLEPLRGLVDEVFLCGPEPMMDGLVGMLRALDVPAEAIHRELFFTPRSAPLPARKEPVHLTVFGRQLLADPRRTLLESALAAKLAVPYSCTMGGCGECRAQLTEGHVSMAEPNCLSHRERAEGAVLPCISYPLDDVRLDYPDSYTTDIHTAPPGEESPR